MLVWLVNSKINNKGIQWGIAKLTAQEPEKTMRTTTRRVRVPITRDHCL